MSKEGVKIKATLESLTSYIQQNFTDLVKQEANKWWCDCYRDIAIMRTQFPEIEKNLDKELKSYNEDSAKVMESFMAVNRAVKEPRNTVYRRELINKPFMAYLFNHQERIEYATEPQLVSLIDCFLEAQKTCTCKIDPTS